MRFILRSSQGVLCWEKGTERHLKRVALQVYALSRSFRDYPFLPGKETFGTETLGSNPASASSIIKMLYTNILLSWEAHLSE